MAGSGLRVVILCECLRNLREISIRITAIPLSAIRYLFEKHFKWPIAKI